jgi:hypothetical protein
VELDGKDACILMGSVTCVVKASNNNVMVNVIVLYLVYKYKYSGCCMVVKNEYLLLPV